MRRLTVIASFFRTLLGRARLERDLDAELRAYLDERIRQRMAHGVSAAEARRQVLAEEGGAESVKEHVRDGRVGAGFLSVLQDLRYGARSMRRSPGFSVVAGLTVTIGIGANVAMFTVIRSVLWRPLPYPAAAQLTIIETDVRGVQNAGAAPAEVLEMRARTRAFVEIGTINGVDAHVLTGDQMERVSAVSASDNVLRVLGINPARGRHLNLKTDMGPASVRAVLVSHGFWQRFLGARPDAVGSSVNVNNMSLEVVGILPEGFRLYLPASTGADEDPGIWFPAETPDTRDLRGYNIVARLAPGRSVEDGQRDVEAMLGQFASEQPMYRDGSVKFRVSDLQAATIGSAGHGLRLLGLTVGFVLLIGCVNVANLTLARSSGRVRELAVRRALGATRGRIFRQILTESMLLATIAGGAGVLLALATLSGLEWLKPTHLPRQSQVGMDPAVLLFSLAMSLGTGILIGLLPALRFAAAEAQALRAGRAESVSAGARRLQRLLIVGEIALSIVPIVAAGLMLRSFVNLNNADLGFHPDGLMTARVPLSYRAFPYPDKDRRVQLYLAGLEQVRQLGGVEAASAASPLPFAPGQTLSRYGRPDQDPGARALATRQSVMPGYVSIVGTRLLEGRDFSNDDITQKRPVVIVDQLMAQKLWPSGSALGQTLAIGTKPVTELEVIGVTQSIRVQRVRDSGEPHYYVPYHVYPVELSLVVRTRESPTSMAPGLKRVFTSLGTGRAVFDVRPMPDFVRDSIAETRFTMLVLSGFALTAMVLAGVGLYGTLSYLTTQRAREFGVRQALGATTMQIVALVAREGLVLTTIGALAGIAAAAAVTQTLRGLLYGVGPVDPLTIIGVAAIISGIALIACLQPAFVASRVSPAFALRSD